METARGIIQIESGKNYYWRATRPEPAHSAGSHLRIRGGKEESGGRGRGRKREIEEAKEKRIKGDRKERGREEGGNEGGGGGERRNGWESKVMMEVALGWRERPRHHDLGG